MSSKGNDIVDKFHHGRGQKDASHGKPIGTSGDPSHPKYGDGYRGAQFDYDKKRFGEIPARVLKDDRDRGHRYSEKKEKPKEEESPPRREEPLDYCPICGEGYDGYYCDGCGYDPDDDEDDDGYSSREEETEEEEEEETEAEKRQREIEEERALTGSRGPLYITKYMSKERLNKISESDLGLYTKIIYVPPDRLVKYKCDRCGHEWETIWKGHGPGNEIQDCMMGCSKGADGSSLWGLYKIIKGLIAGRQPFGYGRLISSEEL